MIHHKFSRQRESIIENLKTRTDHPTADMVYFDIRRIYPSVSLGTVYRNLSLLAKEGRIQKIVTDDGVLHFDYNADPHNHFICRCCGNISDLCAFDSDFLNDRAAKHFNGRIDACALTFHGLCENCLKSHKDPS